MEHNDPAREPMDEDQRMKSEMEKMVSTYDSHMQ
jgi:hypothetical protein